MDGISPEKCSYWLCVDGMSHKQCLFESSEKYLFRLCVNCVSHEKSLFRLWTNGVSSEKCLFGVMCRWRYC